MQMLEATVPHLIVARRFFLKFFMRNIIVVSLLKPDNVCYLLAAGKYSFGRLSLL